ncbi:aldose 1-epimerase [Cyclobacterium plantarum]|uniref:Aldose 1-epimerase n=1 Tax=Cyclobacterium plantarum TaxID=2716263 RepID=A0ABX0HED4_9BACT|nr:aldose 1-epimerase [Cyclobacterium plantarum]NHE58699.1 aldose 1-epimerase [Cyclobacterium plantarum]
MGNKIKIRHFSFLIFVVWTGIAVNTKPPEVKISNGLLTAHLYLPDPETGYYRASRFDWSGVISSLQFDGHEYFGQWFEKYDPKINDAIMGPVDEFGPLGYEEADPGETFIKIGVGGLRKVEEDGYRFMFTYDITNPGKWTVTPYKDRVEFTHNLQDETGYGYQYTKTVKLVNGKPKMLLTYSLKNTGKKPINTTAYNHHFFVLDGEPTGPDIKFTFPYHITAPDQGDGITRGFGTLANIKGGEIRFERSLFKGEQVYSSGLRGFGRGAADHQFSLENSKTGAGVMVKGDRPLEKLVFWANPSAYCAEPYIRIKLLPGETVYYQNEYTFYSFEPGKN